VGVPAGLLLGALALCLALPATLGGNLIRTAIGVGDGAGVFTREFEFEPGLVVADVSRFCAYLQGVGSITVYATGFLARDK